MSTTVRIERGTGGRALWARVLVSPPAEALGFAPGLAVAVIGWARAYLRAWAQGAQAGVLPPLPPEVASKPEIWPFHVIFPILAADAARLAVLVARVEPDLPPLPESRPPLSPRDWRLPPICDAPTVDTLSPTARRRWQGAGVFTTAPAEAPASLPPDPDGPRPGRRSRA
jgi:hypothetical protein